jgi:Zn-dependent M28 family amino/carboxypeptidase
MATLKEQILLMIVFIISGHLDSRVTDVMNTTADAPGANDGSGVAAMMELAKL